MNYQGLLLKKKGQFGVVWFAAHHPSKITKQEVLQLDLASKCKEIKEYLINGESSKPKFSLVVSSHLMLGLVVLLNKKNKYILDELVQLNSQLQTSYMHFYKKSEINKQTKTLKKVRADEPNLLTLNENLPQIGDITTIESLIDFENQLLDETIKKFKHAHGITLDESLYDRSNLIEIDYDFQRDSFDFIPPAPSRLAPLPVSSTTLIGQTIPEENIIDEEVLPQNFTDLFDYQYLEKTIKQKQSTAKKPSKKGLLERSENLQLLGESTILTSEQDMERMRKEKDLYQGQFEITGVIAQDRTENIEKTNIIMPFPVDIMPELYQETIIGERDITTGGMVAPDNISERILTEEINELAKSGQKVADGVVTLNEPIITEEIQNKKGITRTISLELKELQAKKLKKQQQAEKLALKKKKLLIDEQKQISSTEMLKRMKTLSRETKKRRARIIEEEEDEEQLEEEEIGETTINLSRLFSKKSIFLQTKYDFMFINLYKQPSCQLSRQTTRLLNTNELNKYVKCDFLRKNMISGKISNENYFYLTQSREQRSLHERSIPRAAISASGDNLVQEMTLEGQRKVSLAGDISNSRRRTLLKIAPEEQIIDNLIEEQRIIEDGDNQTGALMSIIEQKSLEQPEIINQVFEETGFLERTEISVPHIADITEQVIRDDYEKILQEKLESERLIFLQDEIKYGKLTSKCLESSKPRKLYACKLFFATLSLLAKDKIKVNQNAFYANIQLEKV